MGRGHFFSTTPAIFGNLETVTWASRLGELAELATAAIAPAPKHGSGGGDVRKTLSYFNAL